MPPVSAGKVVAPMDTTNTKSLGGEQVTIRDRVVTALVRPFREEIIRVVREAEQDERDRATWEELCAMQNDPDPERAALARDTVAKARQAGFKP